LISEKELDELAWGHHCLSPHEMDCFSQGFRASEKIYLEKIKALEAFKEEALELARFYADLSSWHQYDSSNGFVVGGIIEEDDIEADYKREYYDIEKGGKRARVFLEKHEGEK